MHTFVFVATKVLSRQKSYLWQLPSVMLIGVSVLRQAYSEYSPAVVSVMRPSQDMAKEGVVTSTVIGFSL